MEPPLQVYIESGLLGCPRGQPDCLAGTSMLKWLGLFVGSAVLVVVVLTVGLLNVGRFEGSEHFWE